jgi:hypothetical protein
MPAGLTKCTSAQDLSHICTGTDARLQRAVRVGIHKRGLKGTRLEGYSRGNRGVLTGGADHAIAGPARHGRGRDESASGRRRHGTARHGTACDAPSSRRTQSKQTSEQTNKQTSRRGVRPPRDRRLAQTHRRATRRRAATHERAKLPISIATVASRGTRTGRTQFHCWRFSTCAPGLAPQPPHLHRDWTHRGHICAGTGLTPSTSGAGLGSPRPPTSSPGLGSSLPHPRRDCASAHPAAPSRRTDSPA